MKHAPDIYNSDNYLVLDFEVDTSHGDYGHPVHETNALLLACYRNSEGEIVASWGGEFKQEELLRDIDAADFIVAHNAKYELGWLRRCGLDLSGVTVFDTKIAEYVLMGNLASGDKMMAPRSTSLDQCCIRRGWRQKDPVVDIMMKHGINPVQMPRSWLEGRCRQDVETTEQLFIDQRDKLKNTGRLGVLLTRCIITPLLADMEFTGMKLDAERVKREFDEYTRKVDSLSLELEHFTGGINWKSPKQVAEYLYNPVKPKDDSRPGLGFKEVRKPNGEAKRTPKGKKLTGTKDLGANYEKLKCTNEKQKKFLELKSEASKANAALTKNLQFFMGSCKEKKGLFHAVFNQTATATHRLSSSGIPTKFEGYDRPKSVQFQNLPRIFKPLHTARDAGWLMAEADGSQLEFRVAAQLSGDPQAVEDILAGHDVHRFTASVLNDCTEAQVTKRQRQEAKADTFKPLYGGQSGSKAQMAYYEAFRQRYSILSQAQQEWVYEVLAEKRLITPWGMRYYWPYAKAAQSGYVNVTSSVYNYPIQAFATAEIIPIAIRSFWDRVKDAGAGKRIRMLNTIHDSIICEVKEDALDEWKEIALQAFTVDTYDYLENVYGYSFDTVPLGVGMGWGTHWSDPSNPEEEWNVYRGGSRVEVIK